MLLPVFKENINFEFYSIISNLNVQKKNNKKLADHYQGWFDIIIEKNNDIKGLKIKDNPYILS